MEPGRKCPRVVEKRWQLQKDTKTDPRGKKNSRAFLDRQEGAEGRLTSHRPSGLGDTGDTGPPSEEGAQSQECAFKLSAAAPGTTQVPGRCQGLFVAPVFRHIPQALPSACTHQK